MDFKKCSLIICLIIFMSCISGVSAGDVDDAIKANDLIEIDNLSSSQSIALENNPDGSFTDLANEIANADGELNLNRNYAYSNGDSKYRNGIAIDKQITINGNGFNISNGHAFNVQAESVTLDNINFVDCQDITGGAVYWSGSYGILSNCNFVNCSAMGDAGGAVYWSGSYGILSNCNFIDCYANDDTGGAVSWWGTNGVLSGCSFVNCSARTGGAVSWNEKSGLMKYSSFADCSARSGGAVSWYEKSGILSGCSFRNCSALNYGGGIYFTSTNCSLINSYFQRNSAIYGPDWYSPYSVKVINRTANISTVLNASSVSTTYGVPENLIIILKDVNDKVLVGEQISVLLDNVYYNRITDFSGKASISIPTDLLPNDYEAVISYLGNSEYESSDTAINVVVNKIATSLSASDVSYNGTKFIVAALEDVNGNPISGVNVKISVGNLAKTLKTDANGQVALDISSLTPGTYTASIKSATTDIYERTTATANIAVDKIDTILTVPDVTALYNTASQIVATFKDINGNVISGVNVKITVGSLAKTLKTNASGQVALDVSGFDVGTYTVAVKTATTDVYNRATQSATYYVLSKLPTILTVPDVVVLQNGAGSVIATLSDINGNAISGVNVKITVGSLAKTLKTNAQGQVALDISSLAVGNYSVAVKSATTDIHERATASATAQVVSKLPTTLTVPDAVAVSNAGGSVVATLKDIHGNAISGVNVKITVGTLAKTLKTDSSGKVALDISSLAPGTYSVAVKSATTDIYERATATASAIVSAVKVDTVLTVPDVTTNHGSGDKIVATFNDVYGNSISGVNVKITVGSIAKTLKSDSNGQVALDVSTLAPGTYNASIKTATTDVYNRATATAKVTIN